MSTWLKAHTPASRENRKTARNAFKLSLELAEKALDGFPLYGPKAAIGSALKIMEVAQVRRNLPLRRMNLTVPNPRNMPRMPKPS
jgi:hypothetical protein